MIDEHKLKHSKNGLAKKQTNKQTKRAQHKAERI